MILHIVSAVLGVVVVDNIYLRKRIWHMQRASAESVALALSNCTVVDGTELPKPDDARWRIDKRDKRADGTPVQLMSLGDVTVDAHDAIYVGSVNCMPSSGSTKKYCTDVWRAYRSRVARKAIESTT